MKADTYILFCILFAVWFLSDFFNSYSGGNWSSGKQRFEIGLSGFFSIVAFIIFTLIWGGIFWW